MAATSASNAWAVGGNDSKPLKTLIAHWNGKSWQQVPSPTPGAGGALFGVTATSARNAWAVGCAGNCYQGFGSGLRTLILHWNGKSWQRVASPSPGTGTALSAVAAASAGSAWAVGCTLDCFISSASPQTVILHWNGHAWKQVASPAGATTGALNGVAATSPGNAWVVGCTGHCFGPDAVPGTLIAHWNGSTWKKVAAPSPAGGSVLTGVATRSPGSAWAVGYTRASGRTLILRWNGGTWRRVASPTPAHGGELLATAIGSPGSAWAVGASDFGNLLLEQLERPHLEVAPAARRRPRRARGRPVQAGAGPVSVSPCAIRCAAASASHGRHGSAHVPSAHVPSARGPGPEPAAGRPSPASAARSAGSASGNASGRPSRKARYSRSSGSSPQPPGRVPGQPPAADR